MEIDIDMEKSFIRYTYAVTPDNLNIFKAMKYSVCLCTLLSLIFCYLRKDL